MTYLASRVGVHRAPEGRDPTPCRRCGVVRHLSGRDKPLCRDCIGYLAEHDELHRWVDPHADPGTCNAGHPWDEANTAWRANGRRDCRRCRAERERLRRAGGGG
jgi:hypothetical protein